LTRLDALPKRYANQAFPDVTAARNKYGNVPTEYRGYRYHSKREASFARDCDLLLRAGQLRDWNQQVKVSFDVTTDGRLVAWSDNAYLPPKPSGVHFAKHLWRHWVDFLLVHADGSVEPAEVKSSATRTRTWEHNLAMLEATLLRENPKIIYRIEQ
jgi:hypothetical protein